MGRVEGGLVSLALVVSLGACKGQPKPREERQTSREGAAPAAPAKPITTVVPRLTLPKMPEAQSNPSTPEKVALGRRLFFDPALSVDGSVSCYSCHQNENGTGGATPLAVGAKKLQLTRHSPGLWNVGYLPALYWDGRAPTLEAQALGAWAGGNMGVGKENLDKKAQELAKKPTYKAAFASAFPAAKIIAAEQVVQALAAYERTLVCDDTAYDKFAQGDSAALSADAKAGLELFEGKAMCVACHSAPHFTAAAFGQGAFYNIGVGTVGVADEKVDVGRMKVTSDAKDWAAFRPPSLRNVAKSAPYFHDGHVATLKDAVRLMASGGYENKNRTPLMADRKLSDAELNQLVTFLESLNCPGEVE
jgi:cytochrome c peroxidase